MYLKILGAILIIVSCGGYGIMMVVAHKKEVSALQQLVQAVDVMICELEFHLTPLPELCSIGSKSVKGPVSDSLNHLSRTLNEQSTADVDICVNAALRETVTLPKSAALLIQQMGQTMGRFDLHGQLSGLSACKESAISQLDVLKHEQPQRLRSYQTLSFCAGAALAIILF